MLRTVLTSRTLYASRRDAITTTTEAYQFRRHRGKRNRRPYLTTTTSPTNDIDSDAETKKDNETASGEGETGAEEEGASNFRSGSNNNSNDLEDDEVASTGSLGNERLPEDPVVGRLMTTAGQSEASDAKPSESHDEEEADAAEKERSVSLEAAKATRPVDIPDITSLFTDGPMVQSRKETAFDGLETHEVRSSSRANLRSKLEHRESPDNLDQTSAVSSETEAPDSALEDSHTIGPYDSVQEDYVNDQPDEASSHVASPLAPGQSATNNEQQEEEQAQRELEQQQQDEESSTFLPEAEPDYRYNMKWRSMGKVLDPPSK